MTLSNREIQNALLYEGNHELLQTIEKNLRERLAQMHDGMTKADLFGLLVIAVLKKNFVETDQARKVFDEYLSLVDEVEREMRTAGGDTPAAKRSADTLYRIFLSLTVQRCIYVENLLAKLRSNASLDRVRILRYSLEIRLAGREGDWGKYATLVFYKCSTLFGTSFLVLLAFILFVVSFFAAVFYGYDLLNGHGPVIATIGRVDSFDYYFYVSMATFSNLGVDTSLAANLVLRAIFSVEQIFGLLLFWLAISLIGRRFQ